MNIKNIKSSYAFTLIELMVVIAVIAVLAGALMVQLKPQSLIQKGRDAKRMQDIETMAKALNLALAEGEVTLTVNDSTCTTCNSIDGSTATSGSGYVKFAIPIGKTGLSRYLATLPIDPLNTGVNMYSFGSTTTDFELNVVLEHPDNVPLMSTDGGNAATVYEAGSDLSIL